MTSPRPLPTTLVKLCVSAIVMFAPLGCDAGGGEQPPPDVGAMSPDDESSSDVAWRGGRARDPAGGGAERSDLAPVPFDDHPAALPWAFAAFGRWDKPVITWRVDTAPPPLTVAALRRAVTRATAEWSRASGLAITEALGTAPVDIAITAERPGEHGDSCAFDASTLAHAFFPSESDPICPHGKVHVNAGQRLTLTARPSPGPPYDLESVLLHELGHALGLGHSTDPDSVMWSTYAGTRRRLATDDVAGMAALYGGGGGDGSRAEVERWLGVPSWQPPRCVIDGEPVDLCFDSRGLVGDRARVTILEWDKAVVTPVGWIDVVISPDDVFDGGSATTCVEWSARWEADGAGSPEFLARVVVDGLPAATMAPDDGETLHVGKAARPCPD
jgi:hypothetical protein